MNILVIHDRDEIRKKIVELCCSTLDGDCSIVEACDYISARDVLANSIFDLAIIDLTLPHVKGKFTPNYDTSYGLIMEIMESSTVCAPGDFIGVTRDAAAATSIGGNIGPHLMGIIEETEDGNWKQQLEDRVNYVRRSRQSRQLSLNSHYDYDACIITALDVELHPYRDIFEISEDRFFPGAYKFVYTDRSGEIKRGIVCSIGRAGPAGAASKTQALLIWYRPRLLLMSGFCGGIKKELRLGDIAIFETVFDWDYGKWVYRWFSGTSFYPRPDPIGIRDLRIHGLARRIAADGIPEFQKAIERAIQLSPNMPSSAAFRLVPAASGSAVVTNPRIVKRIKGLNEAIGAIDMESYGVYLAARMSPGPRPEYLVVKAVSDYCDIKKNDDLQAGCSLLLAEVISYILKEYEEDFSGHS